MIEKIIGASARNRFLIGLMVVFLTAWGLWAAFHTPLDAIPDLSDVQVIIFTEWPGRAPQLVEDQITYPIVTTMLGAPKVQVVRGFSFLVSPLSMSFSKMARTCTGLEVASWSI